MRYNVLGEKWLQLLVAIVDADLVKNSNQDDMSKLRTDLLEWIVLKHFKTKNVEKMYRPIAAL